MLEADHHGLEKVKERIVEYLAVRKLNPDRKGPIICFVGPPGVGKTSLGRSIAKALDRSFARVSLGGVKDESEIRGHRRTYVGARPGRIIQEIKRAETGNPVMVLDEIDKLGSDFRGDPSSALLEVLDPEQNHTFSDHYIEVPFDLSRVLFIATANSLLDHPAGAARPHGGDRAARLHGRRRSSRSRKRHLLPRQLEGRLRAVEEARSVRRRRATRSCIASTPRGRRAQPRALHRDAHAQESRAASPSQVAGEEGAAHEVDARVRARALGPRRTCSETGRAQHDPRRRGGSGLDTNHGGDILFIEATRHAGRQAASAQAHRSARRRDARIGRDRALLRAGPGRELGIDPDFFKESDVHLHVPQGAVPKDGPSAGITAAVALASLLSGRRVRSYLAMTGEITLRGKVLPVGGVKEKLLAARRARIREVVLPAKNAKDLVDVPEQVRNDLVFHYVDSVDQVMALALEPKPAARGRRGRAAKATDGGQAQVSAGLNRPRDRPTAHRGRRSPLPSPRAARPARR